MLGLDVCYYLEVSPKFSSQEPLPLSACMHMHAYAMLEGGRTSTGRSLAARGVGRYGRRIQYQYGCGR
jgi:hypothetical protein